MPIIFDGTHSILPKRFESHTTQARSCTQVCQLDDTVKTKQTPDSFYTTVSISTIKALKIHKENSLAPVWKRGDKATNNAIGDPKAFVDGEYSDPIAG